MKKQKPETFKEFMDNLALGNNSDEEYFYIKGLLRQAWNHGYAAAVDEFDYYGEFK